MNLKKKSRNALMMCHSDGAARGIGGLGASAYAIIKVTKDAVSSRPIRRVLAVGAIYLKSTTAFQAEARTLGRCAKNLVFYRQR